MFRRPPGSGLGTTRPFAGPAALCLALLAFIALTWVLWPTPRHGGMRGSAVTETLSSVGSSSGSGSTIGAAARGISPVPMELFVMSKCPDAQACETELIPQARTLALSGVVYLRTTYIMGATPGPKGKMDCMHGPSECAGNVQQLCVQSHTPRHQSLHWLGRFLLCSWEHRGMIGRKELLGMCLPQLGVPLDVVKQMEQCTVPGAAEGQGLVVNSAARVTKLGVKKSCTVFIDNKLHCIHDGGGWYNDKEGCPGGSKPEDFTRAICSAYASKATRAGAQVPAVCAKAVAAVPARISDGGDGAHAPGSSGGAGSSTG